MALGSHVTVVDDGSSSADRLVAGLEAEGVVVRRARRVEDVVEDRLQDSVLAVPVDRDGNVAARAVRLVRAASCDAVVFFGFDLRESGRTGDPIELSGLSAAEIVAAIGAARAPAPRGTSADDYRLLVEGSRDLISRHDLAGEFLYVSPACRRVLGYEPEELLGRLDRDLVIEDDHAALVADAERLFVDGESTVELRMLRGDGELTWVERQTRLVRDADAAVEVHSTITDIGERRRMEAERRLQPEVIANMAEGVMLVSAKDWTVVYANRKFEQMFEYEPGELVGQPVDVINAPADDPVQVVADIQAALAEAGTWSGEVHNVTKHGRMFWCRANVANFTHPEFGEVSVAVHTDITEARELREALQRSHDELQLLATTDDLTGLWNRRRFHEALREEAALAHRRGPDCVLLLIDLDDFKSINDLHGHETGDRLLAAVGDAIKAQLRAGDCAARVGGDEFVVLLRGIDEGASELAAARYAKAIRNATISVDGVPTSRSASVGAVLMEPDAADAQAILAAADRAMYAEKQRRLGSPAHAGDILDLDRIPSTEPAPQAPEDPPLASQADPAD